MNIFQRISIVILFFSLGLAARAKPADTVKSFVLSEVRTLHSRILGEDRTINIYLPEGYHADSPQLYPVIYLLDGGVQEDFVHITGLVQYNTQPWINRFPRSVVVGIENTNRKRDFSFPVANLDFLKRIGFSPAQVAGYGGSGRFIRFLAEELQPFIGIHYKVNDFRTLIGESFGGLLATEILLKHRNLFNTYIILSPSLWWGRESLIKEAPVLLKPRRARPVQVYIGAAKQEENQIMYEDAVALADVLKQYGRGSMTVYYDYLSDETHATIIHQGVYRAFRTLYPLPGEQH